MLFASGCELAKNPPPAAPPTLTLPVATWAGGAISRQELLDGSKVRFAELEATQARARWLAEREELESLLSQRLLEEAAKTEGFKSAAEFVASFVAKQPPISDEDVQRFFEAELRPRGKQLEGNEGALRQHMADTRARTIRATLAQQIRAQAGVTINLPSPKQPQTVLPVGGRAVKGPPDAPVVIVELVDLECSGCKKSVPLVNDLLSAAGGQARFVVLHAPGAHRIYAKESAIAVECAGEQSKFWEMYEKLFETSPKNSAETVKSAADELGLDVQRLEVCLSSQSIRDRVEGDVALADRIGVTATPTFFVNGVRTEGVPTLSDVRAFALGFGR